MCTPQSDSVQVRLQGVAGISSSVATTSSLAFILQDFPGRGRAVPSGTAQGAQRSWEEQG